MVKLMRVLTCDAEGCDPQSVHLVQGEDDDALKEGWKEIREEGKPPLHMCPTCVRAGKASPAQPVN